MNNGHCGCVELVEYIPFDYLHVAVGVWIKKLYFLKLLDKQDILQYLRATVTRATVSLLTLTPHPYLRRPFAVGDQIEKRRGKRERNRREEIGN